MKILIYHLLGIVCYLFIVALIYGIYFNDLIIEKCDKWIGKYYDESKKITYIFLVPIIGMKLKSNKKK